MPGTIVQPKYNKDGSARKRGSRVALEVSRDAIINVRTYTELRDRLDALVILTSRSSRASLIEKSLTEAAQRLEGSLGIMHERFDVPAVESSLAFRRLTPKQQKRVLAIYRRIGWVS